MTFNNKFKKQTLYKKKVIKILFLNLLRQNSKVYSLSSGFDVQRNNVHLHGGLIKKQSLNILVVHKTVVFGDCVKCTKKWMIIDFFKTFFYPF